jgi:hypothetical protein
MAVAELFALAIGWALAHVSVATANRWCDFCLRAFPDRDWYTNQPTNTNEKEQS